MTIVIEQRTRAVATDPWGAWTNVTVDTITDGTLTNTDLVEYRVKNGEILPVSYLTENANIVTNTDGNHVVVGDGVFDKLMETVVKHLRAEYTDGRLKGSDYANVYVSGLQAVLAQSVEYLQGGINLTDKLSTSEEQRKLLQAQQALVARQTKGFDDDAKQKLLKQSLDSWSVAYSVAQDANSIPDSIKVNVIDSIMKNAYTNLGIAVTNDPIGEA